MATPDPVSRLVQHLARLPGIGERTATRLAFHLVRAAPAQIRELAQAILDVVDNTSLCTRCSNISEGDTCRICADQRRDPSIICVVGTPSDLAAIERGGHFRGQYHVLHGLLSPLEGIGPEDLHIGELLTRLRKPGIVEGLDDVAEPNAIPVREVILAVNASVEGEATAMYLAKLIKPMEVSVSRIASGIPVGGELEYSDQATIARAFDGRSTV